MRTLRPGRLFTTTAGVWVLDETQPVAVVLDPVGGRVRRVVSWTELPPPPPGEPVTARVDGEALWVQNGPAGPLLRLRVGDDALAVWTDGLTLAAAGRSSAWCTSPLPPQEIVHGADAAPVGWGGSGTLLRADADGRVQRVHTDRPVRGLRTTARALWVQLDAEPWSLRSLGAGTYEVLWSSRWVPLPWDGDLPERLTAAEGQEHVPAGSWRASTGDGSWPGHAYDPDSSVESGVAVRAGEWTWRLGWDGNDRGRRPRAVAAAFPGTGPSDAAPALIDLGGRTVVAATAAGDRLAVVVSTGPAPARVLVVDPVERTVRSWPAEGTVDIGSACWPVGPRPLDAGSYVRQVLDDWSRLESYWQGAEGSEPLARGMSAVAVRSVGEWPRTQLECTFAFAPCPGVRLRRRLDLFDELGAVAKPEHAQIHLMEDLDTRALPPVEDAVDGVLDV
ncbi:hypothetical protein [Kineococcus rhizosphaerae]|uniref:Uncharacterized protein n=1 Tax=Kineococcus rhizosphaerae TaxID=559628 RepID=A0A2T0R080_9ACTN|nr:hypothetical protein [Kineococcus rhizosphaerae]PRY12541.1 hypothetical protein CLV37_110101 [Kineococcus rhizosphaerae]